MNLWFKKTVKWQDHAKIISTPISDYLLEVVSDSGDGAEHRDVILLLGVCVPAEFCRGPEIALSVEMTSPCPLTPKMITAPNDFEGGYEFLFAASGL